MGICLRGAQHDGPSSFARPLVRPGRRDLRLPGWNIRPTGGGSPRSALDGVTPEGERGGFVTQRRPVAATAGTGMGGSGLRGPQSEARRDLLHDLRFGELRSSGLRITPCRVCQRITGSNSSSAIPSIQRDKLVGQCGHEVSQLSQIRPPLRVKRDRPPSAAPTMRLGVCRRIFPLDSRLHCARYSADPQAAGKPGTPAAAVGPARRRARVPDKARSPRAPEKQIPITLITFTYHHLRPPIDLLEQARPNRIRSPIGLGGSLVPHRMAGDAVRR